MNLWDRELAETLEDERNRRARRKQGTCQARGCIRPGRSHAGRWWLCKKHLPLWREHNRIVDRILEIPVR